METERTLDSDVVKDELQLSPSDTDGRFTLKWDVGNSAIATGPEKEKIYKRIPQYLTPEKVLVMTADTPEAVIHDFNILMEKVFERKHEKLNPEEQHKQPLRGMKKKKAKKLRRKQTGH